MNIAILSDIHGNLVALDTVLRDIQCHAIDQVICLGDVAATGPHPAQCLHRLYELGCPVVRGNTEDWLLNPQLSPDANEFVQIIEAIDLWCAQQLSTDELAIMRSFAPMIEVPLGDDGDTLLAFHGSPHANTDVIAATTPQEELDALLGDHNALIFAGGHTHQQLLRRTYESILLNPGSVGMAYQRQRNTGQASNVRWAEYALLRYELNQPNIDLRRVPVDAGAVVRSVRESGMPHGDWWLEDWRA